MIRALPILPLRLQSLTFRIDGRVLIDALDATIDAGGLIALIGPNGAGKSLTLRLCHGLLTPSAGRVIWSAGAGAGSSRKQHAMVFQRPVMLRRSVRENMRHALAAAGLDHPGQADEALDRFGLLPLADRPARQLSGGEQQRLALARARALEPEMLFLDEPTAHLDPSATRQIEDIIASLISEGMTILMATHDLAQARRLARRVLFLNRGRLVEDCPAGDFFAEPRSPEGRAFLAGDLLW